MKIRHIFQSICASVAVLALAACADTDAQYTIPSVDAPVLVSADPDLNSTLTAGLDTFYLTFDKNVFFATANSSQVTINGESVDSCMVLGSDSVLTIIATVPAAEQVTIDIPAGLLYGPEKTPAGEITATWTGTPVNVTTELANTNANSDAQTLYKLLYDNYGSKILSGAMANVNWNTEGAESVYQLTGKYPAIACFDYIHIPYSGESWIDYDDLTPVTNWHSKGGIVAAMWHWLVPTQGLSADVTTMPSDWSGNLQLTDDASKAILANAQAGDTIVVHYKNASGAQGSIKDANWAGVTDADGTSYDYFDIGSSYSTFGKEINTGATYMLVLDATSAEAVKNGIIISGHDYTVTSVNYVSSGSGEMTYRPDATTFDCANILTEGTLEYKTMQRDLEEMATRLKALQDEGIAVLWRPLHEASGNTEVYDGGSAWFWWGSAGADTFKQLWQYMFTYFQEQGVNNLVWVWTGADYDSNWYPGDAYVDVIGADIYNVSDASTIATTFNAMQQTYPNKMVTMSECGAIAGIDDVWGAGGTWSWFMPWYGNYSDGVPHASDAWWSAAAESDNVLMLDDIQ
ncbi:MAG: glycosyl hydrolase [Prevotella sp.]